VREDVPTCAPGDHVGAVRDRVIAAAYDLCVVLNEHRVVLGVPRGDALGKNADAEVRDVMELGPKTLRPSTPIETLLQSPSSHGVKSWVRSGRR
jgi:hypothetical protein